MLYFYEKIDLQFEILSSYELKKNKKRLKKNISIWVAKALEENDVNKEIHFLLCSEINNSLNIIENKFSMNNISSEYQIFIKVLILFHI